MNNKCKNFNYSRIFPIFADKIQLVIYLKTCNNMKSIIRKFVGAALLLALPLSFTSCEDILGPWEKSHPAEAEVILPTAYMLKNVVDNGATVTIPYKIGDTEYTATFYKDGDNYVLKSGSGYEFLKYDKTNGLLVFTYKDAKGPLFDIYVDIENQSFFRIDYPIDPEGKPIAFDGKITVYDKVFTVSNSCPKSAIINNNGDQILYVYYAEGETWNDLLTRYSKTGNKELTSDGTKLLLSDGTTDESSDPAPTIAVCYVDPTNPEIKTAPGDLVLPTDEIGKKGGAVYNNMYVTIFMVAAAPIG